MNRRPVSINVLEAFSRTVHDYPPGVGDLAAAIGMVPGTLYNKANTNDDRHPPTLSDAVLVMRTTGNASIAEAMSHAAGGVHVPLPAIASTSDKALFEIVARWMGEQGQFLVEFNAALVDGTVSEKERVQLERRARRVISGCLELVAKLPREVRS